MPDARFSPEITSAEAHRLVEAHVPDAHLRSPGGIALPDGKGKVAIQYGRGRKP
ncbi:hypothetical protein [Streptomyces rubradiris]|uniref:Uncharacterized protein n=1 Tax=Streptomyces rubradiris TaxID=285531 RepID=A0ABQ3RAA7_STRRR|nr:hypothetical protein [Streptomyces rubradiris]GHH25983.1 hypothetical protein GCM10018792_65840 [Streptomyces rubradiris]GHI52789.1 hypothetical protein Srubr_26350 [Streptomyces rubradiris]